jgi:hypothetical protein
MEPLSNFLFIVVIKAILLSVFTVVVTCTNTFSNEKMVGKKAYNFTLRDQHDNTHYWTSFKGKPTIIILSDRAGSDFVDNWVKPLQKALGSKVKFVPVAEVSSAPGFVHGMIRSGIRDKYNYPLYLDWEGDTYRYYQCKAEVPNLYFVGSDEKIAITTAGKGTKNEVTTFIENVEKLLEPKSK